MEYYRRISKLECLAELDNSEEYSIDVAGIYTDGIKFYFIAASGCSCWDGDYDEIEADSFEELKNKIVLNNTSEHSPSLSGIRFLITTAESKLPNPSPQIMDSELPLLDWVNVNFR